MRCRQARVFRTTQSAYTHQRNTIPDDEDYQYFIFVVITIVHSFNFILTREIENKMSHVVTVLMFTVSSVDRYIERFIGRDSVDSRSIVG